MTNAQSLPERLRAIAEFVRAECGHEPKHEGRLQCKECLDHSASILSIADEIERQQAELKAHREALGRFLNVVNPVGFDFDMKAEEAFEQAIECVISDREVHSQLQQTKAELKTAGQRIHNQRLVISQQILQIDHISNHEKRLTQRVIEIKVQRDALKTEMESLRIKVGELSSIEHSHITMGDYQNLKAELERLRGERERWIESLSIILNDRPGVLDEADYTWAKRVIAARDADRAAKESDAN